MKKIFLFVVCVVSIMACTTKPNAQAEFFVRGNCDMCKERIDKTVLSLKGVNDADWNVETRQLNVGYDSTKISKSDIEKAIASTGHATKDVPMDSTAHESLPKCCQVNGEEMH